MTTAQAPMSMYSTMQVLAAACAAQRINGGYFKAGWQELQNSILEGSQKIRATEFSNRVLMERFLEQPHEIEARDHDTADKIVSWYRGKLFRVLASQRMSEFEHRVMKILEQPECQSRWDLSVLASVPDGYFRAMQAEAAQQRAQAATGGYVGTLGQRLELECEVIRSVFSQKWNTHYITAVTTQDQVIYFSHYCAYDAGVQLRIKGTVKRQDNNQTQLNRVRVAI